MSPLESMLQQASDVERSGAEAAHLADFVRRSDGSAERTAESMAEFIRWATILLRAAERTATHERRDRGGS